MIQADITKYLEGAIPPGVTISRIDPDTDLIGSGVIDSFGIVGIIEFLEDRYDITVADDDIDPEIFRTVRTIEAYIQTMKADDA
jgi:acyl carrier protein